MSVLHPSRTTRRLIKLASLSLAGLIAGLLSGCTSATAPVEFGRPLDTGWQTAQTYAAATAELPPNRIAHPSPHLRGDGRARTASAPSGHRHTIAAYPTL